MGFSTSMPSSPATTATGDGSTRLPRPAGASGLVMTASTVCCEVRRARSAVTATGGVPAKTRRTAGVAFLGDPLDGVRRYFYLRDRGTGPLRIPDGLHRELALLLVEPVDEQDAVEVVGLVLYAAGEQLAALDRHRVAVHVEPGSDDPWRARRREHQAGQGQAGLVVFLLLAVQGEQRIDQVPGLVPHVVGEHPQADADLRRGEADTGRVDHRLGEVLDEVAKLEVEIRHRLGRGAQHRITEKADGPDQRAVLSRSVAVRRPRLASACSP